MKAARSEYGNNLQTTKMAIAKITDIPKQPWAGDCLAECVKRPYQAEGDQHNHPQFERCTLCGRRPVENPEGKRHQCVK